MKWCECYIKHQMAAGVVKYLDRTSQIRVAAALHNVLETYHLKMLMFGV